MLENYAAVRDSSAGSGTLENHPAARNSSNLTPKHFLLLCSLLQRPYQEYGMENGMQITLNALQINTFFFKPCGKIDLLLLRKNCTDLFTIRMKFLF
jgi:hypothetical protein